MIAPRDIALGILAGGRGTRLGGCDKAWIVRDGIPQVQRLARRFADETGTAFVSANGASERFEALGLRVVRDRAPDLGPIGGLHALAQACDAPWLLTVPVDLVAVNDCLLPTLASAGGQGASVEDDDGPQPLVALWRVDALRTALAAAPGERAVHALQDAMGMPRIRLPGVRIGNLNTPDDLADAGATLP